jgi:formylglycine-generating enzyme required for sulfatase activity
LKAADLNQNFAELRDAINAQQVALNAQQAAINSLGLPDCPAGYPRDAGTTTFVVCKKGLDEVVKVGSGGAAFWIDRYEASVWSHADGTGQQYGIPTAVGYPSSFPVNGQYTLPLYALSIAQVLPSASLTWFQAVAACDASGKHLANRQEWFRAAKGTIDPGPSDGTGGLCFTQGGDPGQTRMTGAGTGCRSSAGAEDMIGNLWEWTDEWYAGLGLRANGNFAAINLWPGNLFNADFTVNIASQARTTDDTEGVGLPAAASRGGSRGDPLNGGLFALDLMSSPDYLQNVNGFRCVIPR